jgi:hypothetical protein
MGWESLIEKAIPILYDEQGISADVGRYLDVRAHLGAYILQSVHGWTDRFTEEMVRFYIPARLFCGYLESEGSLDHTAIEDFRNRFGEKGAQLITAEVLGIAKQFGLTSADDVDMDTTVQEAGITHPTEMKLMQYLLKKLGVIHEKLKGAGGRGIQGIKKSLKEFGKLMAEYRFFAKTKEKKEKILKGALLIAHKAAEAMGEILPGTKAFEGLQERYQRDLLRLHDLVPQLLDQIGFWLRTGKVAQDKIVSLWKAVPRAISKGKVGKKVEFGRKWIINCYRGGYMLVMAPSMPKMADAHCVIESLSLHSTVFDTMPKSFATDRGMSSTENLELCLSAGIKKIGIQPKGQAPSLVGQQALREMSCRRAGIEPRIGHLKTRGLGRSRMKSDVGDLISGYRSALSWNLSLLTRDLGLKGMNAVPQC